MRAALGANRARLLQQLITEAMALGGLSAALGIIFAHWAARAASAVAPAQLATQSYTVLDARVLGFADISAGDRCSFRRDACMADHEIAAFFNTYNVSPSVDAVQEFRIQIGQYSAEFGGAAER